MRGLLNSTAKRCQVSGVGNIAQKLCDVCLKVCNINILTNLVKYIDKASQTCYNVGVRLIYFILK